MQRKNSHNFLDSKLNFRIFVKIKTINYEQSKIKSFHSKVQLGWTY
jgi:hypothetical protein